MPEAPDSAHLPLDPAVLERLVRAHREFLGFVESRVRDRGLAEDLLQAAYVKAIERGGALREPEHAVAWFYRLLRNALADHGRRAGREARLFDHKAAAAEAAAEDPELHAAVCACLGTLLPTLKPEYAEVLRRADLEGVALADIAAALGITVNNTTVRLHRARRALGERLTQSCGTCATHGCFDCECGGPAAPRGG